MIGSWIVSATIRFSSNGIATMRGLAVEAGRMNAQLDGHTSKLQRMTQQLEAYRTKMLQVGQATSGALALGGAAFATYGVVGAAQLERSLTGVQIATNQNSQAALQRYAALAFKTSGITAQGVNTIGQEMQIAATSGLNDPTKLTDAFTRIAKAADVLWIAKGQDPNSAVRVMSQMAHLFGSYSGKPFQHMLDRAVQMMFVQPEGINAVATQGRYFIPTARTAGVSEDDIFRQLMTMGQTGFLKARGGSGLSNIIGYLSGASAITGHLSKAQHLAMHTLGLTGINGMLKPEYMGAHGVLLLQKVVDHLEAIRKNFGDAPFLADLRNAFLKQGGNYMAAELRPATYAKSQQNWAMMNAIGTLDTIWSRYRHDLFYQWGVFQTNLENIPKAMFFPLLKDITPKVKEAGEWLGKIVEDFAQHPDVAKQWVRNIEAFTMTMGGLWAAFTIAMNISAIQMPFAMARLSAAITQLTVTASANATALNVQSVAAVGPLGRIALGIKGLATAGAAFLASPLGVLFVTAIGLGAVKGLDVAKKHLQDSQHGPGFADKYQAYLHSRGGKYASDGGLWGNMTPPGGGMTPDQFAQHLAQQYMHGFGIPSVGNNKGVPHVGLWGLNLSPTGPSSIATLKSLAGAATDLRGAAVKIRETPPNIHVTQSFSLTLVPGTPADQAQQIIEMAMRGINAAADTPRSALRTTGTIRTHARLPAAMTTRPAGW